MTDSIFPSEGSSLNYSKKISGIFCDKCGEEDQEVCLPFVYFMQEFLQIVWELDGRAYRTIC